MKSNKALIYKQWLDELNNCPSEDFFIILNQYLNLLKQENPEKIDNLEKIYRNAINKREKYSKKAVKELEPVLKKIEQILKANKDNNQLYFGEIEKYKSVVSGTIVIYGSLLADTLYNSIRLTLENPHNRDCLMKSFGNIMSNANDFWYVDYQKATKKFPAFKKYREVDDILKNKEKREPWGAYTYLEWANRFFINTTPDKAGKFVKNEIISKLRRFILYLISPTQQNIGTSQKITYSFDKKKGLLIIKDKEITFKRETRKIEFLALLIKSAKYIYFSEAVDELEGRDKKALKNAKNTYYEVCRGIEARLLKEEVADFLDYNYNKARISPLYKKTSR